MDAYHLDIGDKAESFGPVIMSTESCSGGIFEELYIPENSGWSDGGEVKLNCLSGSENDGLLQLSKYAQLAKTKGYNTLLQQGLGVNTRLRCEHHLLGYQHSCGRNKGELL